ncbi:MAG: DUF4388 domain-containing protein [Anaeromyxobacter sp.]
MRNDGYHQIIVLMPSLPERKSQVSASSPGFRATLSGMGVADLVQMNCLSGQTCSVKVTSETRVGWLHFAQGNIVHASTGAWVGDKAVLEILSWQEGSFEPVGGISPERRTVETGWQNLLLLAAQQRDEGSRATVLPLERAHAPVSARVPRGLSGGSSSGVRLPEVPQTPPPESTPRDLDVAFARIDDSGNILFQRGDVEDLIAQGAYAAELAQMIAEQLGLERATSVEMRDSRLRTWVNVGERGELEIIRGSDEAAMNEIKRHVFR